MIVVLGKNGFVGSTLCEHLTSQGFTFEAYGRKEFPSLLERTDVSIVINCAMPSGRFLAKSKPFYDFKETVSKTANIKYSFPDAKIIQISSISASVQLDTIYGKHKRAAELLLDDSDLIIRLGPLYHKKLTKGALIDIIENKTVYVSGDSKYGFTPLEWVCDYIIKNLNTTGLIELGAIGFVKLKDLAYHLGSESTFIGAKDDQVFTELFQNQPNASEVIDFCKKYYKG